MWYRDGVWGSGNCSVQEASALEEQTLQDAEVPVRKAPLSNSEYSACTSGGAGSVVFTWTAKWLLARGSKLGKESGLFYIVCFPTSRQIKGEWQ